MKGTGLRSKRRAWRGEGEHEIKEYYEKLLLQAQKGNKQALELLCQFVYASAQKYARTSNLPPVYDPADFAQDVVVEFIEQIAAIRRLRTWLVPVLVGQRASAFRRFHDRLIERLELVEPKLDADSKERSAEEESRQIAHLDVHVLVNQLSELQRAIVILHCIDSMSFDDVSRAVGMKPSTVRMYFSRSKKRLQEYLNILHGEDANHGTDT